MPYYTCPWCGSYQHQSHTWSAGKTTVPKPSKGCDCQPTIGLVWRNDAARQSHYYGNKYVWLPDGTSQQYFGQRSPGRWISLFTDEAVPRPEWARWVKVPVILDRRRGREFKALLELEGKQQLVEVLGVRRPGLYHALVINPPADYFADSTSNRKPGSLVVIVPNCMRKKYARSPHPKGLNLKTVTEHDRSLGTRYVPRWTEREFAIAKWQYIPVDEASPPDLRKPLLKYAAPPEAKQKGLIGKHPGGNTWCHTPIHECEWEVDPKPGYDAMRKHLDDHDFKHLSIDWVQRRFLFYTSDGHKSKQTGQIEYAHPTYGSDKRVLLWAGECWACQMSVKLKDGKRKVVTPGLLYVADDMTFIATHQCLRIGQSVEEYQKGINLYAPHAAPMSLVDYVRGPLSDYWNRNGKVHLIRPKMKLVRAKEVASSHELQDQLLAKVQKKYAPPPPKVTGKDPFTATHMECPGCHGIVPLEDYDSSCKVLHCGECGELIPVELPAADLYFMDAEGTPIKIALPMATHVTCQKKGCSCVVSLEHYDFQSATLHCPVCKKSSIFPVLTGTFWAIKEADWVPAAYMSVLPPSSPYAVPGVVVNPEVAKKSQAEQLEADVKALKGMVDAANKVKAADQAKQKKKLASAKAKKKKPKVVQTQKEASK